MLFRSSRARLILPLLEGRGKAIKTNLPLVLMDIILKVLNLTLLTSNRALSPSWTGPFVQIILLRVVVFTIITLTIVPSYNRCGRCGSPKQYCKDKNSSLLSLPIQHLVNWLCLLILSLSKDLWLSNHLKVRWPCNLLHIVPSITRFS